MPGFSTHYLFGVDAYKRIPHNHIRKNLYRNHSAYALGLQGPDIFYYNLPFYLVHSQNIGAIAHVRDTRAFFTYLLESRTLFTGKKRQLAIADAYISGFIGHYTLDCAIHPYIYAHTKYTPYTPPKETDYFGQHAYFETELDNTLLFMKKQMKPSQFHQNATVALTQLQKKVIAQMLTYAYNNTYPGFTIHKYVIYSAFFCLSTGTRLVNDPSGQKKALVRIIEKFAPGRAFLSPMVPSDRHHFIADPMNMKHHTWHHPWNKEASTSSFLELYQQAGALYDKRLRHYYAMVQNGFHPEECYEFCQEYGNRSFLSGLPI